MTVRLRMPTVQEWASRSIAVLMALGLLLCTPALASAQAITLATPQSTNNGQNGVMFDVTALNDVTITSLATHMSSGATVSNIYGRSGTHVGFEDSNVGWTLLGTGGALAAGTNQPVPVTLNVAIPAGQTYALYLQTNGSIAYRNGTSVGTVDASDANLQIKQGTGKQLVFGNNFRPRVFTGTVTYVTGLAPPPAPVAVPTMSEWAMILFGLMLAGGAALYIQRRRLAA